MVSAWVEIKRTGVAPRRPLVTVEAIVEDFGWRFPPARRDLVVEYTAQAKGVGEAITRACLSRDANGRMHNHQSRVSHAAKDALAHELTGRSLWLLKIKRGRYSGAYLGGFHELWCAIRRMGVYGIGPVTEYDVAVRLGAWLGVEPEAVYLHAGVLAGMTELLGPEAVYGREWLAPEDLPAGLRGLKMDEVEDIMCTYRGYWRECGLARKG